MEPTRSTKVGPNDRCPCGSGKKFKKCCRDQVAAQSYTQQDRINALRRLDEYISEVWAEEDDEAYEELWGRFLERADELPTDFAEMSDAVHDAWFAFDRPTDKTGSLVVDDLLRDDRDLSPGERAYLTTMRRSSMRLFEVVDVVPGISLTLRDALDGTRTTVHERSASKTIPRNDWLAARLSPRGASGRPELEMGPLPVPALYRDSVLSELRQMYEVARASGALEDFHRSLPPFFHQVWAGAIFEPAVPELRNPDGDPMVETRVTFDVVDGARLAQALQKSDALTEDVTDRWSWHEQSRDDHATSLGVLTRNGETFVLECNSVKRGERGRALLESLCGDAIKHRATTHADVRRQVADALTAQMLGRAEEPAPPEPDIPFHVKEALVLDHYAKHYRAWVDEPVPALDGLTPRAAARDPRQRLRVADLIRGIESMYLRALREGEPAYDPSWMWSELDLDEAANAAHPPPLAHERVAQLVPGSGALAAAVADRVRSAPGFDHAVTVVAEKDLETDLEVQRFLRADGAGANDSGSEGALAAPYLRWMVNYELHRRKSFWVDESLAYMLAATDVALDEIELRVPFPCFALVFTDRYVLSLAERLVARDRAAALAGQLLRVVTAYVIEDRGSVEVCIACDALGSDLPHLIRHSVSAAQSLVEPSPELADVDPQRRMLRIIVNAILYATSASVRPERRAPPRDGATRSPSPPPIFSSDEVYFLPGAIEISHVRSLQDLERAPSGRVALRKFMVRGHWRRAAENWTDKSPRWVKPYWKGPGLAAVIERTYRLK